MKKHALLISTAFLLCNCSVSNFPGLYHAEVQQGNLVEKSDLKKLKKGMTKQQVLFVLGSPSFKDTFNENRWDYFFSREYNADETKNHPMVVYTLLFNKNGLEKIITPDKNDILNRG